MLLGHKTTIINRYPTQSHYLDTDSCPNNVEHLSGKWQVSIFKSLVWLDQEQNSWSPTREVHTLPIRLPRPMLWARENIVMGEMKMGNIVPIVGIEPTSLALQASVLPLHHAGSLMSSLYQRLPVYAAPCPRGQCRHTQGGLTNIQHIACRGSCSWHQCHGWDENGKYCA